jgi:hypothetical protein
MAELGSFLGSMVTGYGQMKAYEQQATIADDEHQLRQQQIAEGKMTMQMNQQKVQAQQQMSSRLAAMFADHTSDKNAPLEDAQSAIKKFSQAASILEAGGDHTGAAGYRAQAKEARGEILEAAKVKKEADTVDSEALAKAAYEVSIDPSPENQKSMVKAGIKRGEDISKWPLPGTPEFQLMTKKFARANTTAEKELEWDTKAIERADKVLNDKKEFEVRAQERAIARGMLAESRNNAQAASSERAAERRDRTEFTQTEHLNTTMQREAKPIFEDRQRVQDVKELLSTNSAEGDQQVRQALPALLGHFKGRATNLYYKDNKNYGDVVNRISGMLSHAFTGRYAETDRKALFEMVDKMEKDAIDPALSSLEKEQKKHAEGYKLDSAKIRLQGDFNRTDKPTISHAAEKPAGATEVKTLNGVSYYKKDGKWYQQ